LTKLTPIYNVIPVDAIVDPSSDSTLTNAREITTNMVCVSGPTPAIATLGGRWAICWRSGATSRRRWRCCAAQPTKALMSSVS
jgi:hypothetical protein